MPLTPKLFVNDQSSCTKMPTRYQSLPSRYPPPPKQMWQQNFPFLHFFWGRVPQEKRRADWSRRPPALRVFSPRAVFCAFRRFLGKDYALPGLIWHLFLVAVKLFFIALSFPCFFFFFFFLVVLVLDFFFFFLVLFCFFEVVRGPRGNSFEVFSFALLRGM